MFWKKPIGNKVSYGHNQDVIDEYNVGVRCLQAGNTDKAIEVFLRLQAQDHPSAIFNLALLYGQGHGSRFMYPECFEMFKRAAKLGHGGAEAYAAYFMRFASGFSPNAPAMLLAQVAGTDICPALVAGTLAADIICNLPGETEQLSYVSYEINALHNGDETSTVFSGSSGEREFLKLLEMDVTDAEDRLASAESRQFSDYTPEERSSNTGEFLEECVSDNGMAPRVAVFTRCMTLGLVARHTGVIDKNFPLPPIEFFS